MLSQLSPLGKIAWIAQTTVLLIAVSLSAIFFQPGFLPIFMPAILVAIAVGLARANILLTEEW